MITIRLKNNATNKRRTKTRWEVHQVANLGELQKFLQQYKPHFRTKKYEVVDIVFRK